MGYCRRSPHKTLDGSVTPMRALTKIRYVLPAVFLSLISSFSDSRAGDWFEGSIGGRIGGGIPELPVDAGYKPNLVYGVSFRVPAIVTRHALEFAFDHGSFAPDDSSGKSDASSTVLALNVLLGHFDNFEQRDKKKQRTAYAILGAGYQFSGSRGLSLQTGVGFQKRHFTLDFQYVGFPGSDNFRGMVTTSVGLQYVWGLQ
jgi:hypothetical protein